MIYDGSTYIHRHTSQRCLIHAFKHNHVSLLYTVYELKVREMFAMLVPPKKHQQKLLPCLQSLLNI